MAYTNFDQLRADLAKGVHVGDLNSSSALKLLVEAIVALRAENVALKGEVDLLKKQLAEPVPSPPPPT